jgi:hypothetical protein
MIINNTDLPPVSLHLEDSQFYLANLLYPMYKFVINPAHDCISDDAKDATID